MIRVLQIGMSSNYGGVESFIINYNRELHRDNYIFDYVCMGENIAHEEEILKLNGSILHIPSISKHPIKAFISLYNLAPKYDIIHINMLSAANILPIIAVRAARAKIVVAHSHNSSTEGWYRFFLHYLNKPLVSYFSNVHLACAKKAGEWLFTKRSIEKKGLLIIHNAIDLETYKYDEEYRKDIRSKYGISDNEFVIGFVGRITLQKNSNFLLDIMGKCLKRNLNIKLMIVGAPEGDYGLKFEKRVISSDFSECVVLVGQRIDTYKYYSAMDVFCMPSLYEGLSFTAIEAQASGLHCFFSNTMAPETKITPNVDFISIKNPDEWVERIIDIIGETRIEHSTIRKHFLKTGYDISTQAVILKKAYERHT